MTILVPLDGTTLADRILGHVRRLLVREDAEVLLLRVMPEPAVEGASVFPELTTEAVQRHLERVRDELAAAGVRANCVVRAGDPANKILTVADEFAPTLIAMATHGRTGPSRWLMGSVAERVLRNSRCPILLANRGLLQREAAPREKRFRRILVPLAGTDPSAQILPLVLTFAQRYESEVVLLHVAPFPVLAGEMALGLPGPLPTVADAAAVVEPYRERLVEAGVPVRVRVSAGPAAPGILEAAAEEDADLVAMTTQGRQGFFRWLFRSVAEQVLRHSPCPVLALRAPWSDQRGTVADQARRKKFFGTIPREYLEGTQELGKGRPTTSR